MQCQEIEEENLACSLFSLKVSASAVNILFDDFVDQGSRQSVLSGSACRIYSRNGLAESVRMPTRHHVPYFPALNPHLDEPSHDPLASLPLLLHHQSPEHRMLAYSTIFQNLLCICQLVRRLQSLVTHRWRPDVLPDHAVATGRNVKALSQRLSR